MFVPYVSKDNNLNAFKKMKVLFIVEKIRAIDFLLMLLGLLPFLLNAIMFHLIFGYNEIQRIFYPIGSFFRPSGSKFGDWVRWHGLIHIFFLTYSIFKRIVLSFKLWRIMKRYSLSNPGFKWNKKDKFWRILYTPFISFKVYAELIKFSRTELYHKYNL